MPHREPTGARVLAGAVLLLAVSTPGVAPAGSGAQAPGPGAAGVRPSGAGIFVDGTAAAGIDFRHVSGAFGEKRLPETNGAGVSFLDADGDGWIDVLFPQGTTWEGHEDAVPPELRDATMALYRNRRDGTFEEMTRRAGLDVRLYGFGAAPADYDDDGDTDFYLTAYGPNRLFENDGDGGFVDVTDEAGVDAVGNALGVALLDHDGDGWLDIAVANDTEPNFLFENRRDGTFREVGMAAGMALDAAGLARAGMGIDVADLENDGGGVIAIGNFSNETIGLFEPGEGGVFVDVAPRSELGRTSLLPLTFGLFFLDYDLDGNLDLMAVNGHVYEQVALLEPGVEHEQRPLLYRNQGDGRLVEVGGEVGGPLARPMVGRGGAYADIDRDGDLDMAVTEKDGPARLWINRARDGEAPPRVVRLRLGGDPSNRDAIGARVRVTAGEWSQVQMVRSGSSYVSQSEPVLTFGLGHRDGPDTVEVSWPDGARTTLEGTEVRGLVDHETTVHQTLGIVDSVPLRGSEPEGTGAAPSPGGGLR